MLKCMPFQGTDTVTWAVELVVQGSHIDVALTMSTRGAAMRRDQRMVRMTLKVRCSGGNTRLRK